MTYECGYNGEATVRVEDGTVGWVKAEDMIHVVAELATDPHPLVSQTYVIGAWCKEANAYHATLSHAHTNGSRDE